MRPPDIDPTSLHSLPFFSQAFFFFLENMYETTPSMGELH